MTKLNEIISTNNVTAYGFAAFKGLASKSNNNGTDVVVSTLSPAVMYDMGIQNYYSPVLPRGTVFNTTDEVIGADLDANVVSVFPAPSWDMVNQDHIIIVSRHIGTIKMLKNMYPNAIVLDGNVSQQDISKMHIIGTLPPHLIQYCLTYRAITIKDFDYVKDGDLQGDELINRVQISDPITVAIQ